MLSLIQHRHEVVLDNGIVRITFLNPDGIITSINYNGLHGPLQLFKDPVNRGYWDLIWNDLEGARNHGIFDIIKGTEFRVIFQSEERVEISFTRGWDPSQEGKVVPLHIDKRFIMIRGSSGFYSYSIYDHKEEWPAFGLEETRIVFKLRKDKFHYMARSDNIQRFMPLPDDRLPGRGKALAYPEAVLLESPLEHEFVGEVDDKYQYSCENKDLLVHGWICTDPPTGFWQITPTYEYRSGGPLKQNLTSHVGPTSLTVFLSSHYGGEELMPKFREGEAWKKVFGPVFIYLNSSVYQHEDLKLVLWEDAKSQMITEVESWPYYFVSSPDFFSAEQRGRIAGNLQVLDRYMFDGCVPGKGAFVGLAPPGEAGSWQRECKKYQFWTQADEEGFFSIPNIIPSLYNLYAWVPGFIGDYKYDNPIIISSGCQIEVGSIVYEPPRHGPTLWEIGYPDRSAAEFYIPDPDPTYVNKLFVDHPDRFRQYGLWERYGEIYMDEDLVFTIGTSEHNKDWFFAQVTRKVGENRYKGTTWKIKFMVEEVKVGETYKLRLSIASATLAELQVAVNEEGGMLFSTGLMGRDNGIARHGIHGLYWLFSVDIPAAHLLVGQENILSLTQPRSTTPFQGFMYDYIRFEAPPSHSFPPS